MFGLFILGLIKVALDPGSDPCENEGKADYDHHPHKHNPG
jgi:hypothetical protein